MMRAPSLPSLSSLILCVAALLSACGGGGGGTGGGGDPDPLPPVVGPAWPGFARDAQHTANSAVATQDISRILWSAPVDLAPQYTRAGNLLIHYGSPVITSRNTVLLPLKTGATGGFQIQSRSGASGALRWSVSTDYVMPSHNWVPSYNLVLSPDGRLYAPGAGGKLMVTASPDASTATFTTSVFYGSATYAASPATYDATVYINTPVTADASGNLFFGFVVTGSNPAGLSSGFARLGADGSGRWVAAATASGDASVVKPVTNSAPALSADGTTLYVAANSAYSTTVIQTGYLLALDAGTLAVKARRRLLDPASGTPAWVPDDGTASPTVAPDARVYFGVLESNPGVHNARGWLLQFTPALASSGAPGSFGWDITATIVPRTMVPSYTGSSSYLLGVKYNNYSSVGTGDGLNRLAILDPDASQADSFSSATVMREVFTILGPTFESGTTGPVKEWCINTMAADPLRSSLVVNSEDGILYRWDLTRNALTQSVRLNTGLGQAYTPTAVGPDGVVYAISNAVLYAVGR